MLDPVGDQARDIDLIWRVMLAVCGTMYLLVLGFLAWALWRARSRPPRPGEPPAAGLTAAEPQLQRGLAGWAALIAAGLLVLTTVSFLVDASLANVGRNPLHIQVTANQWWWEVSYPGEGPAQKVQTANELHLPLGRPALIELHGGDVIHSFWAPNLAGKTDLIPGRVNQLGITPRRLGRYRGQCAEFCGLQHANMAFEVVVEEPARFEQWRRAQAAPAQAPASPEAAAGQQVFGSRGCAMCHSVQGPAGKPKAGPDLTHLKSRARIAAGVLPNTRGDLQAWVADPQTIKPGSAMPRVPLTADELNAVVSYLETLR